MTDLHPPAIGFQTVRLTEVEAWPGLNPRIGFDPVALEELAQSIEQDGLIQPVAVAPAGKDASKGVKYWLFAGERRLRACRLSPAATATASIDVIVRDVDEATAHRLAGIENLDRNDLTAIEEGVWLARELELTGNSQKELGEALGRSQAWVANRIRLLELPAPIRKLEIKRAAKETSPVLLTGLRSACAVGLRSAGAVEIQEGHQYARNSNMSFRITRERFAAFKKEHSGRCVQAPTSSWRGEEGTYTFAVTEWSAIEAEAIEAVRSTRTTGGVSKKKLQKPKLGPSKEATTLQALKGTFGHDNVILFDNIVDPSKIEPANVARVELAAYQSPNGKECEALAYVGPNVRAIRGARTRRATPIRDEVATQVQTRRMDKAADLSIGAILTGLLNAASETNYSDTLKGMIEAELGREVEFDRYAFGKNQVGPLKIPAKSLRRIAAGLARIATADVQYWDLESEITKAIDKRVTKDTAKARKAWIDEHAPEAAK